MKKEVVLTVGITAHAEGVVAHKTMQAVFAGLKNLDIKKYPYEIIVHIDNGDTETITYFKRYENNEKVRIIYSHFGDLGLSRNCIVKHARGKFISFLDADDMLSSNWYVNAIKRVEDSKETIMVHPNIQFNFGAGTRLEFTVRKDSFEKFEDAIISAGVNRWCSAIMGERKTFLEFPYMETKNGYGYEDYNLNTNTVGHGIKHKVAPETVMFYRQKAEGSLLSSSNTEHVVQPYVSLLDIDYLKSVPEEEIDRMRPRIVESERRGKMLKAYYAIRGNRYANFFITPVAKMTKRILGIVPVEKKKGGATIPKFMLEEWKKINVIESQLYPTKQALAEIFQAEPDDYDVGLAYYDLVKTIPKIPDYIFIVPWVRIGGADKVLVNYIKAIKHHHPEWSVAVITTLPDKNFCKDVLPDNAYIIDYGGRAKTLWPTQRELLFSRLMTQLQCKRIHIINSQYGYDWVATHKKFVANECELAVSIFSTTNQYTPGMGTYANPFLVNIYPVVKKIYTDNKNMLRDLVEKEGFEESKIEEVHQPIDIVGGGKKNKDKGSDGFRVLWASRIDHEKIPEIVLEIADELNGEGCRIDMYGELAEDYKKSLFEDKKGIKYCGKFTSFEKISEGYDVFLYTSVRDGMPNVILEAASVGLPIVASNVGGVGEVVIDGKTGLTIDDIMDAKEYAKKIKYLMNNSVVRKKYVDAMKTVLKKQYSWDKFFKNTRDMFEK